MKKILSNILYNGAYQALLVLLPLATTPYISRVLGAANIGIYSYYFTFAAYFVMLSKLGVANYGNRSIAMLADDKKNVQRVFSEIYGVQFFVSALAIVVYGFIGLFKDDTIMYLFAGFYVLSGVLDISWLFFGLEEFKKTAIRNMVTKCVSVVCVFVFVRERSDLPIYTLICCGTHFVTNGLLWFMLPMIDVRLDVKQFRNSIKHLKPMLILFLPVIGISIYNYMDKLMLGKMVEISELGYYQSSEAIMSVPVSLIAAVGTVMLPRMSSMYGKGQEKSASKYLMCSMWLTVFVVAAFAFGIMGVAPEFVAIFYGNGYDRCVELLRILMLATIFIAMANVVRTQVLIPKGNDKVYVGSIFLGAAVNLVLNSIMIPKYGAAGASIATVMAEATVFLIQTYFCGKYERIWNYIAQSLPFVGIGCVMMLIVRAISLPVSPLIELLVKIAMGGCFYTICASLYYFLILRKRIHAKS